MTLEEERAALAEKIVEIRKVSAEMDVRFARLPITAETEPLREKMGQMLVELHRMEETMQRLLELNGDENTEGGMENGND